MARAVGAILERGKVVRTVDVLVGLGMLSPRDLERWLRGEVPYLERVVHGSHARLSRLLRILGFHAHDLSLTARVVVYDPVGGGRKRLRFTKTGDPKLEKVYARHFNWPGKGPFPLDRLRSEGGGSADAGSERC